MKRITFWTIALLLASMPAFAVELPAGGEGSSSKLVRRYGSAADTYQVRAGERSRDDRLIVEPVGWRYRYGYGPRWGNAYYGGPYYYRPYGYRTYYTYPGYYAYRPYYNSFGPPAYYYGPRAYYW